jgi:hypothetical protein
MDDAQRSDSSPGWKAYCASKYIRVHFSATYVHSLEGGTGHILEYFGPGVFDQSCTGKDC